MSLPADAPAHGQAPKRKKRKQHPSHRPLLERGLPQEAAAAGQQRQRQRQQQQQPSQGQQPQHTQQQQEPQLGNGNTKFARALGSTDYHTREQGLAALSRWLLHRPAVSELDMLKLWRGVFFCFWHSDKEPVQEDLAMRLAGLLPQLQPTMARLYWAGMLATLRAEWFAMDRHRVNKFLMLVRKFVAAVLQRMAASNWDVSVIRTFTGADLPMGQALLPLDHTKSLGFSYHLADVWLPELRAAAGEQALPPGALQALLQPFADVLQLSGEAAHVARVRESVFEALVQDLAAAAAAAAGAGPSSSDSEDEDDRSAWAYCAQLDAQEYAEHLFSLGAAPDVKSRNREALYGISKQLERVAAKRRKLAPPASGAAAAAEHGGRMGSAGLSNGAADGAAAAAAAAAGEGGSASKKQMKASKKRSKAEAAVQQALADAEQQLGAAEAAPPRSSSKKHKQEWQQQEQPSPGNNQQQQPHQHTPGAAAAAVTPGSGSQQKRQKHKQGGKTPGGTGSKPRGVVINLRENLYHEHGAPPPAAHVRTPPRSKPKGSALKPVSKFEFERSGGRGKATRVTPNSVPRVRAAAFF